MQLHPYIEANAKQSRLKSTQYNLESLTQGGQITAALGITMDDKARATTAEDAEELAAIHAIIAQKRLERRETLRLERHEARKRAKIAKAAKAAAEGRPLYHSTAPFPGEIAAPPKGRRRKRKKANTLQLLLYSLGAGMGLVLTAAVIFILSLWILLPEYSNENWLYLTEKRPQAVVDFGTLPTRMSEQQWLASQSNLKFYCSDAPQQGFGSERSCYADISALNNLPAMGMTAHFAANQLAHITVSIPWWEHRDRLRQLHHTLGSPVIHKLPAVEGLRLEGWQLSNGSGLFYNFDRYWAPTRWSQIIWTSAQQCQREHCFSNQ